MHSLSALTGLRDRCVALATASFAHWSPAPNVITSIPAGCCCCCFVSMHIVYGNLPLMTSTHLSGFSASPSPFGFRASENHQALIMRTGMPYTWKETIRISLSLSFRLCLPVTQGRISYSSSPYQIAIYRIYPSQDHSRALQAAMSTVFQPTGAAGEADHVEPGSVPSSLTCNRPTLASTRRGFAHKIVPNGVQLWRRL